MVAAFNVMLDTGGSNGNPGVSTNTDPLGAPNIRFKRADDPNIDGADPNIIKDGMTSISRWKQIYLQCVTAPTVQVDNVKIYTGGPGDNYGPEISVDIGNISTTRHTTPAPDTTGYSVSDTDDEDMAGHGSIMSHSDFFVFDAGNKYDVLITEELSKIDGIGETTNYVVLQMYISDMAAPGNLADKEITWEYDEI